MKNINAEGYTFEIITKEKAATYRYPSCVYYFVNVKKDNEIIETINAGTFEHNAIKAIKEFLVEVYKEKLNEIVK